MKHSIFKIIFFTFVSVFFVSYIFTFASEKIYDKLGRNIEETIRPTAESKVDQDAISDALRRTVRDVDSFKDPSKNINSKDVIMPETPFTIGENKSNATSVKYIRHMTAINHVENAYELIEDREADRLMLKIMLNDGVIYAKNGFYEINNKKYYFDEDGHMVLGPCKDNAGNDYFFSYETGELLID